MGKIGTLKTAVGLVRDLTATGLLLLLTSMTLRSGPALLVNDDKAGPCLPVDGKSDQEGETIDLRRFGRTDTPLVIPQGMVLHVTDIDCRPSTSAPARGETEVFVKDGNLLDVVAGKPFERVPIADLYLRHGEVLCVRCLGNKTAVSIFAHGQIEPGIFAAAVQKLVAK